MSCRRHSAAARARARARLRSTDADPRPSPSDGRRWPRTPAAIGVSPIASLESELELSDEEDEMSTATFTATHTDDAGRHHETTVTVEASTRNAAWKKAVTAATSTGENLIFLRWEGFAP